MLTDVVIRPLELEDFTAFIELQSDAMKHAPEVFGSDYAWFESLSRVSKEQRYEKYLAYPYQFLLGAFRTDLLLGMVGFSVDQISTKTRHKGRLWGMYVVPEVRGKGVATELVETLLKSAMDSTDCEQVQLSVGTENQASYRIYLRLGFTVYGVEKNAMKLQGGYADEYLMVKFLR